MERRFKDWNRIIEHPASLQNTVDIITTFDQAAEDRFYSNLIDVMQKHDQLSGSTKFQAVLFALKEKQHIREIVLERTLVD